MNETIKKLLNDEPRALKAINETFHIDWNKPFQAFTIEGKTTINQILKRVYGCDSNSFILVLNWKDKGIFSDRYSAALLDSAGNVIIEQGYHHFYLNGKKLDTYYRKSDFRDDLKHEDVSPFHIVIVQNKQDLTKPKKPEIDYIERYMKDPERTYGNYLIRLSDGIKFEQYRHDTKENILDKSGYIVEHYKEDLQRRAKKLKADREKAAVDVMDFSKQIEELKIRITAKKLELIEQLKNASTSKEIGAVSDALKTYSNGLASILESYERMIKGVNEKSYASIEDFNRHYNRLSQMLIDNGKKVI